MFNKEQLQSRFKQGFRNTKICDNIMVKTIDTVMRRDSNVESTKTTKVLQLRIATDSDSPIYQDWFGDRYIEQISSKAFDESLNEVKSGKKIIYSFADHDMDSKNVISSTNRENTKLYKDSNNDYVMEFELDESIELHKTLIRLVENGEINANSFIFYAQEIEFEEVNDGTIEYRVYHNKGDLLSIDPVLFPFYPQNKTEFKGINMAKEPINAEEQARLEAEQRAKELAEEAKQAEEAQRAEEARLAEEQRLKEEADAKAAEEARLADEAQKQKEEELDKSSKFKALSIAEQRQWLAKNMTAREIIDAIDEETKQKEQAKRDAMAAMIRKSNGDPKMENTKLMKSVVAKFISRGNVNASTEDIEAFKSQLALRNAEAIETYGITEDELKLFVLRASDLTGADATHGALIIPVSTDPSVVGQDVIVTPEFNGASRMAMSGLEEKKVPVDVDTMGVAAAVAEGADAPEQAGTVVKVQFAPTRYPLNFSYNPLLAEHADFVGQKTTNATNAIKKAWLKGYYDSLVANAGTAFAGATYAGGATKESNIESIEAGKVSYLDMEAMILDIEATYGTITEGEFKAEMKPETWTQIVKSASEANNTSMIRVVAGKTMYGAVEVIVRKQYPDAVASGKFPITLSKKSNTKIYGGVVIVKNSVEVKFLAEMNTRLVTGRGEAKLCDPFYTTRTLVIKA